MFFTDSSTEKVPTTIFRLNSVIPVGLMEVYNNGKSDYLNQFGKIKKGAVFLQENRYSIIYRANAKRRNCNICEK